MSAGVACEVQDAHGDGACEDCTDMDFIVSAVRHLKGRSALT